MTRILLLAGIGLIFLLAGAAALYRGRIRSTGGRQGRRSLLRGLGTAEEDALAHFANLALMQIGHSRRIAETIGDARRLHLLIYVCETGFEHRRQSHFWMVAAYEVDHGCTRATVTAQDWLRAAAWAPACRELRLTGIPAGEEQPTPLIAIVEDADEWDARFRNGLSRWFMEQPADRSWEVIPGLVVGYKAGRHADETLRELGTSVEELARLLSKGPAPSPTCPA